MRFGKCLAVIQGMAVVGLLVHTGCGGSSTSDPVKQTTTPPSPVTVTLVTAPTDVFAGDTVPLKAQVVGSTNTGLNWTVNNIPNGDASVGTITGSGESVTYTAPTAEGNFVVAAISASDPTKLDSRRVKVSHTFITAVVVGPTSVTLNAGAQKQFSATVSGTGNFNANVTWSAQKGSVTSAGLYTAPAAGGTDVVTATSVQDTSKSSSASVTVTSTASSITAVVLTPATLTLNTGAQQQFNVTVTGTGGFNGAVTWSAQRGTVTSLGLYTAPSTGGSDIVTAKSVQDTTKSATSAVTVTATTTPTPTITAVTINPTSWTLTGGSQRQFAAVVTGTGAFNSSVTWSAQRGSVDGTGLYTAPSSGSDVVTVKSVADSTKLATSSILVQSGCAPAASSSTVVNVRDAGYGAKGDGSTDDTAAIQKAVNAVAGTGGTVLVPDGTYMVNAVASSGMGIRLGSNMTFSLSSGAVLKALPNSAGSYAIVAIHSASNVNMVGGTLLGERSAHLGTSGEWGSGLDIDNADHVVVQGVIAKECWGDGFYVGGGSSNVTFCNVTGDHNRRQGLSVTSVDGMVVRNSVFKNTTGTDPEAGIDIEPNDAQTVNHVLITGCTLTNNAGGGFQCGFNDAFTSSRILNTVFDGNTVSDNGVNPVSGGYRQGVKVCHALGTVTISNNVITNTLGQGIMVMDQSANTIIDGNTVTGTKLFNNNTTWTGGGIYISASPNSRVTNNTVKGNAGLGIWNCSNDSTIVISGNTVSGNGQP